MDGRANAIRRMEVEVVGNVEVCASARLMALKGDFGDIAAGQFIDVDVPGFFLRRPMSVFDKKGRSIVKILYKVVGGGTETMAKLSLGERLSVLTNCGRGFPVGEIESGAYLIGGGIGVAPLYLLAKELKKKKRKFRFALGYPSKGEAPLLEDFLKLDRRAIISTIDGSIGFQGTVLDALKERGERPRQIVCCGPLAMMRALAEAYPNGFVSLEAGMGCGYGICNACTVRGRDGRGVKVCKDGPVFRIGEVSF